jgi:DNA-binding transcriptional regulator GbsR (MarR family)
VRIHSYDKIITYLNKNKVTYKELADATGLSYDGVRGRVSELRKCGYNIETDKKDNEKMFLRNMKQLIPFKLHVIKSPGGNDILTMSVPVEMHQEAPNRDKLKDDFKKQVGEIKKILKKINDNKKNKKDKKLDVELNWEIGNIINNYQMEFIKKGFYCYNYEAVLEEIIQKHRSEFWRIRKEFSRMYRKRDLMPWGFNTYNEIIVVKEPKKRKELFDFVKKEFDETGKTPSVTAIRKKRWEIGGTRKGKR